MDEAIRTATLAVTAVARLVVKLGMSCRAVYVRLGGRIRRKVTGPNTLMNPNETLADNIARTYGSDEVT